MAIAKALSKAAKSTGKFLKEKGRQAVTATKGVRGKAKPAIAKAKDVTTKAGTKIKLGAKKAKDLYESGIKKETLESAKGKVTRATTKVKEKAKPVVAKVKGTAEKAKAKAQPIVDKAKEKGAKLKRTAERSFVNDQRVDDAGGGNMADLYGIPKSGQSGTFQNQILGGYLNVKGKIKANPKTSAAIGALAAGALTASIMASNNNPKSDYEMKRSGEGFQLKFNDEGKNKILTGKALSQKEIDEVRSIIAYMESIIVSDNPKTRKKEFIAAMDQLSGYGVNSVIGKNLMINMPQSLPMNDFRRRW
tara:strand:+ start:1312 stop:2226 length:915 start_codon:yes stop_codon:yes gene_type:complete